MTVRNTSHLTVRPDGQLQRVSTPQEQPPDQEEADRLGDEFEKLLEEDDRAEKEGKAQEESKLMSPLSDLLAHRDNVLNQQRQRAMQAESQTQDPSVEAEAEDGLKPKEHKQDSSSSSSPNMQSPTANAALVAGQVEANPSHFDGPSTDSTSESDTSASHMISEVADQVASQISTIHQHGSDQVQIQLRDDVLPQTSMTVENKGGQLVVTVASDSVDSRNMVSSNAADLSHAISERTGRSTSVNLGDQNWTSNRGGADQGPPGGAGPDAL
ncbi:MAG: type III secretion HpaP family protein [Pseudomonadota bacterium]